jgi:hypothetical protein
MKFSSISAKAIIASFILLIAVCAVVPSASAQTPSGTVPPQFFGMHTTKSTIWPTVPFGAFRLWDTQTNWYQLCTSSGNCDFTNLDKWIDAANAHGIKDIVYTFGKTPQWASSAPNDTKCNVLPGSCDAPSDVNPDGTGTDQMWKDFVRAIATHVGTRVQYWEIWNEPHNYFYWSGTYAQLVRMGTDARNIILSINPNAKILSPSGMPKWMSGYLAAGGGKTFDIANLHTYPGSQGPEYALTLINNEKSALSAYGQQGKPLWADEASWGRNSLAPTATIQAGDVARMYLLHWSAGVKRLYWYSWSNSGFGTLWTSTGGTDQAGTAYGQIYKWLVGATMSTPCRANASTWTCGVTRNYGAYTAKVVWNTAGNVTYQAPSQFTQYRTLAGQTYRLPSTKKVTIGLEPIILE